jgi:tape measure domain-containing protein
MAATVAEKIIRIDVVTSAGAQRTIRALAEDMKKVENSTAQMQRTLNTGFTNMTGLFTKIGSFLGAFGIATGFGAISRAVLDSASSYQVLEQRLALVLGTTQQATQATRDIFEISKAAGREVDGVGKLYEKASRSAQQFGLSQANVKAITEGFSQSIRLSGASTQEAYASLVQFGQALASGRLQGDEFRSLMENNSVFMYEFAKAVGMTVSELRKMGTEGKISAKFLFEGMLKPGEDGINMLQRLNKMAAQVPLTFRESFNSAKTSLVEFVGVAAQLLNATSKDKLGLFGPIVTGINAMTQALKEMRIESDALGEGFWEKLGRLAMLYGKNFTVPGLIYQGASAAYNAVTGGGPRQADTLAGRLDAQTQAAKGALDRAEKELERLTKLNNAPNGNKFAELSGAPAAALARAQDNVAKLTEDYIRLRKAQSDLSYGDRYIAPTPPPAKKVEVSKEVESARDVLARYIVNLKEQRDLQKAILADEGLNVQVRTKQLDLLNKLKDAQVSATSAQGKAALAVLTETAGLEARIEAREQYKKAVLEESASTAASAEKIIEVMQRDIATLDALRNKTKASQEFGTDELQRGLQKALDTRNALMNFSTSASDDPLIIQADALVIAYQKALDKRAELTEAQEVAKQRTAQDIVDRENFKRVDSLADEINADLKRGIAEGVEGKTLFDNIQKTFKEKAIDVVLNPVTSLMARALAAIADDFGKMISKQLYGAIAGQTADPIGSLINLMGLSNPFAAGAGGIGTNYSLPTSGVRFGYPAKMGLSYVPFDNFPASLHRGERVLTAQENAGYSGKGAITISHNPNIMIDSRTDQAQVYQIAIEASRQGNAALVEELSAQGVL